MARSIDYELAQVNISRLMYPLDSPELADFVDALMPVNAMADEADRFVWRLQAGSGDATSIRVFDDDWLIVNMSVWRDLDSLRSFMYAGRHRELLKRRREWFATVDVPMTALWWVPVGHRPTVREAEDRLVHVRENGATDYAFTLRSIFPTPR